MITNESFYDYALSYYDRRGVLLQSEFEEDLQKFVYLKKLMNRDDVNPRLILNHIITLYNTFHPEGCTNMLFFKVDESKWSELKTYLVFLNYMPDDLPELELDGVQIPLDMKVIAALREI